ncbi:2-dehydro-3-deoxygalactonokinase [Sphingopyxis sp.]|jgi:2-dehydro-3-deoxygalactonokinase|uniref:2-dehydro-3-deoxygalactonokinase n=1 Tax=Sphingopyxis sp. TaxID=1908224 RepID=UPI003F70C8AE
MTRSSDTFLAVDWGTTNRRAYLIVGGEPVLSERDDRGIAAFAPAAFASEVARLRAHYGSVPTIFAGMIGSNRGWIDAGYVGAPASLEALAAAAIRPAPDILIVPGVKYARAPRIDVMRGEEVQLLGACRDGLAPPDALLCQPGTHCKWAEMRAGDIDSFVTAMTGEVFALLRDHAMIGELLRGPVTNGDAFRRGVAEAGRGDLLASLFEMRPASMFAAGDRSDWASYGSGLVIGTDCLAHARDREVHLLADGLLAELYTTALREIGAKPKQVDSHAAFVAGIIRIREMSA